ncbi:hypothetical protein ADL27_47990, partial [Streptomyces sp. NRRL F-6602]
MGMVPLGIALLRDVVPDERLSSSIALVSASMGIGGGLGLPLSAAVAQYANWRVLFWGSAALAAVIAVLVWFLVPSVPAVAKGRRFDAAGAVGLGAGLVCLLLAVGMSMGMARSLTRPLAVLRLGTARLAADPAGEEPVKFTGRNDEFAEVVRSVNALHAHLTGLHERLTGLETDRKHLVGERVSMAEERDALRKELAASTAHLERARQSIHGTFVNLALRSLGLVERQLTVIENLEESEQDPDRLATLFKLDHFATVMRRHSENLLVLAGAEHGHSHAGPVPLVDVARAAVSETERYERIRISTLPPHSHLAGFAADPAGEEPVKFTGRNDEF